LPQKAYLALTLEGYLVLAMGTVNARGVAVGERQENLQETAGTVLKVLQLDGTSC